MPEPKITARLVLLDSGSSGMDDGMNQQERKALDTEEFKANKALNSKRFLQTAFGAVLKFIGKIVGWWVMVKKFFNKIPGKIRKLIPGLGRWLTQGGQMLKLGLGSVLQFGITINPNLILEWMENLGISTNAITGLEQETQTQTGLMATLGESISNFMNIFSMENQQTLNSMGVMGEGTLSFSDTLDAGPAVDALANLDTAVGVIDEKIAEYKQLLKDLAEKEERSSRSGFPSARPTKVTKRQAKATKRISKPAQRPSFGRNFTPAL